MKADLLQWHQAALEAIAALEIARERLAMNDLDGEEQPFIQDADTALAMLYALPLNRQAVREAAQ
jgi:hypothetical protein